MSVFLEGQYTGEIGAEGSIANSCRPVGVEAESSDTIGIFNNSFRHANEIG